MIRTLLPAVLAFSIAGCGFTRGAPPAVPIPPVLTGGNPAWVEIVVQPAGSRK